MQPIRRIINDAPDAIPVPKHFAIVELSIFFGRWTMKNLEQSMLFRATNG